MTAPTAAPWVLRCPVCGTPVPPGLHPSATCTSCGLPAAAHAGMVVSRIGATLADLHRDRDALVDTLRTAAPGAVRQTMAPPSPAPPLPAPPPAPAPPAPAPPVHPQPQVHPQASRQPMAPPAPVPAPAPRRRVSPQEVLVGLGALLVVAAALALVAVAWTRLGLAFQSGVMVAATSAAAVGSGWAARRGLRATEEGLAVLACALLVIDLAAARGFGLLGLDAVDGLVHTAASAALVSLGTGLLALRRRTTRSYAVVSLVAAQPVLLLLGLQLAVGPVVVGGLLLTSAADLAVVGRLPGWLRPPGRFLVAGTAGLAALVGLPLAWAGAPTDSVLAAALLVAAGGAAVVLVVRRAAAGRRVRRGSAGWLAVVPALAVAGAVQDLDTLGGHGAPLLAHLGPVLLSAAALTWARPLSRELTGASGAVLGVTGVLLLAADTRWAALSAVALAATVPAVLAAVRVPGARRTGTVLALLAPAAALLAARDGAVLDARTTGMLLAVLAAAALGLATVRTGRAEELAAAGSAPAIGLAAALTGASAGAWGQVAVQLAVVGAAGLGYAVVSRRTLVVSVALGDLVLATWVALAGAAVLTVEAYSLPLACALLLAAAPRWVRGPSWVAWGPGLLVGFVPSVLLAVTGDDLVRTLLVVAAGSVAVVAGALTHRQAPFVVGAVGVGVTGVALIAPYAARVDSWVPLGIAGLALLVVGATYERRRQQAAEAVAWVVQMT